MESGLLWHALVLTLVILSMANCGMSDSLPWAGGQVGDRQTLQGRLEVIIGMPVKRGDPPYRGYLLHLDDHRSTAKLSFTDKDAVDGLRTGQQLKVQGVLSSTSRERNAPSLKPETARTVQSSIGAAIGKPLQGAAASLRRAAASTAHVELTAAWSLSLDVQSVEELQAARPLNARLQATMSASGGDSENDPGLGFDVAGAGPGVNSLIVRLSVCGTAPDYDINDILGLYAGPGGADEWFQTCSMGQASVPLNNTFYLDDVDLCSAVMYSGYDTGDPTYIGDMADDLVQLLTAYGYNVSEYDRLVMFYPKSGVDCKNYAGFGSQSCAAGSTAEDCKIWLYDTLYPLTLVHELGHTLGLAHSQAMYAGENYEYGDLTCPMGSPQAWSHRCYNSIHQLQLGWSSLLADWGAADLPSDGSVRSIVLPAMLTRVASVVRVRADWYHSQADYYIALKSEVNGYNDGLRGTVSIHHLETDLDFPAKTHYLMELGDNGLWIQPAINLRVWVSYSAIVNDSMAPRLPSGEPSAVTLYMCRSAVPCPGEPTTPILGDNDDDLIGILPTAVGFDDATFFAQHGPLTQVSVYSSGLDQIQGFSTKYGSAEAQVHGTTTFGSSEGITTFTLEEGELIIAVGLYTTEQNWPHQIDVLTNLDNIYSVGNCSAFCESNYPTYSGYRAPIPGAYLAAFFGSVANVSGGAPPPPIGRGDGNQPVSGNVPLAPDGIATSIKFAAAAEDQSPISALKYAAAAEDQTQATFISFLTFTWAAPSAATATAATPSPSLPPSEPAAPPPTPPDCRDAETNSLGVTCHSLLINYEDLCTEYTEFTQEYCASTCGWCAILATQPRPPPTSPPWWYYQPPFEPSDGSSEPPLIFEPLYPALPPPPPEPSIGAPSPSLPPPSSPTTPDPSSIPEASEPPPAPIAAAAPPPPPRRPKSPPKQSPPSNRRRPPPPKNKNRPKPTPCNQQATLLKPAHKSRKARAQRNARA